MLRRLIATVVFAMAVSATASAQDEKLPEIDFGRYHALVIGINDYQHLRKLNTAVGDAEAVATLLEDKYGFAVTTLTNATRRGIVTALNDLRRTLTENDNLLIYYAGHGVLDSETATGFWLPTDAEKDNDVNWIANDYVSRTLRAMTANHVMVVADSCYSGTLIRATPTSLKSGAERAEWLARMTRKRSRTAMVSGGLEPVLDSGGGGHSVFAKAFLAALEENDGILEGQELFARVSRPVVVNSDQTPDYSDIRRAGHDGGEFMFVPLNVAPPAATKLDASAFELAFWNSIKDSDRPQDFQEYLKQFPEGVFAGLARSRMRAAGKLTALVVPPKPEIEIDPIEAEYVAVKNVNVRAEPTVRSDSVATLKRGTEVHVAGKVMGQNWYLVERDDKTLGYVFGELLLDAETARQQEEAQRKEEERKRAEAAKRQEEERQKAEEAQQRAKRDQSQQQATLATPKPRAPTGPTQPIGVSPTPSVGSEERAQKAGDRDTRGAPLTAAAFPTAPKDIFGVWSEQCRSIELRRRIIVSPNSIRFMNGHFILDSWDISKFDITRQFVEIRATSSQFATFRFLGDGTISVVRHTKLKGKGDCKFNTRNYSSGCDNLEEYARIGTVYRLCQELSASELSAEKNREEARRKQSRFLKNWKE